MSYYTVRAHEDEFNRKWFCTLYHSVCSYKIKLREDVSIFRDVFDKTIISLALVGYK